jgi:hypothetical protein
VTASEAVGCGFNSRRAHHLFYGVFQEIAWSTDKLGA